VYTAIRPHPALAGIVDSFWRFDGTGRPHRVVPDGCMDFLFDLADERGAVVVGPMAAAKVVLVPRGSSIFGVRFRPGAAALFVEAHAKELCDKDCAVGDVTRARPRDLASRVISSRSDEQRCRVVSEFLADPQRRVRAADSRVGKAVALIGESRGSLPMGAVADGVSLGERQLERLFDERIGVRPKLFARIVRLRYAADLRTSGRERDAALALRAGYADQAHFVRESRSIFGATPSEITRERRVGFVQSEPTTLG
jgi:AraC-like DNA-binding protein